MVSCTQSSDSSVAAESLHSRLSTWLLRPYLDLGPFIAGPLHAAAIEECWRAVVDLDGPQFIAQRALAPGFRKQLAEEAGASFALSDPRELPDRYRTDRWRYLCDALDDWHGLSGDRRCRLASLLHSMCLYQPLLELIPDSGFDARRADTFAVQLAFWRASAKFMQNVPNRIDADMSVFEDIALNALHTAPAAFNAIAMIFVYKAKTGAALTDLVDWGRRYEHALAIATRDADKFTAELLTSRFYRGIGFLPQRRDDRNEVVRTMDLAERHALNMKPATPAQELLYRENLHALMESRTKEALWLDDLDQALARSLRVIEVDPYDAKAWVELGEVRYFRKQWQEAAQAYVNAAMLGPPASVIARYMAGVCFRELGQDMLAAFFLKDTLELDQVGISSREEIRALPDVGVLKVLKQWNHCTTIL